MKTKEQKKAKETISNILKPNFLKNIKKRMETQEKIEAIKSEIIKNDPSILDLVFGCNVYLNDKKTLKGKYICSPENYPYMFLMDKGEITKTNYICEIIGRDITINEIIELQNYIKLNIDGLLGVVGGEFWSISPEKSYGLGVYWTPNKPLHLQPEPTISMLYDLIVKNK